MNYMKQNSMNYIQHKHYTVNTEGRDFVMGDLHGQYGMFKKKLDEVSFDFNKDRLFAVGDLIDRGVDSLDCLKLIENPWFFTVLGNHEDMMLRYLLKEQETFWLLNGGRDWFLDLDIKEISILEGLCDRLVKEVPLSITIDTPKGIVGITHAQVTSDTFSDIDENTVLWSRTNVSKKIEVTMQDVAKTYHGHTPVKEPLVLGDNEYIDTGACFPDMGVLTVKELWT